MDDEVSVGPWHVDRQVLQGMRLERLRELSRAGTWREVVLEAEELLDDEPDHVEVVFLLAESLLAIGEPELARLAYEHRLRIGPPDHDALLGQGLASYEMCDLPMALECLREVVRVRPDHAEAQFSLGLALEATGEAMHALASANAFSAARILAPEQYPAPLSLTPTEWKSALDDALGHLPEVLAAVFQELPVEFAERPAISELKAHHPPLPPSIAALLDGEPGDDDASRPERVRVFTRTLSRQPNHEELIEALAHALAIEAADWLGYDLEGENP
jgi:tetratricopeptide (TPR) repeat protein